MPSRISVLLNRNARGLRHPEPILRALADVRDCRLFETHTLAEVDDIAARLAGEGPELVVLAGGDGSVMNGLSAIARAWEHKSAANPTSAPLKLPRFAIIPAGTVSTIASNLGLPRKAVPYAKELLQAAVSGTTRVRKHATLRVRDNAGGSRLGFIFGTGLVAQFFEHYDALPTLGAWPASKLVARLFVGSFVKSQFATEVLSPMPLTLALDGLPLEHRRYSLVVSSVLRDVGLHLRPTFRAGAEPRRLHVVASTRGAKVLAMQLPVVLAGSHLVGSGHVDALAATFRVTFGDELRSYVLDGDRIEAGPRDGEAWVDVERGPDVELMTL